MEAGDHDVMVTAILECRSEKAEGSECRILGSKIQFVWVIRKEERRHFLGNVFKK